MFSISKKNELYIRRAFDLARLAAGSAAPNPMVGAVLVYKDRIIGEGYFRAYGIDHDHAEVKAVKSVAVADRQYISKAELYVSLEPCNFFGKTPACTSLILENKIPKVIISTTDKTPQVSGSGITLLQKNGVQVITGVLEKEGDNLVRYRTNFVQNQRPFVILKYAQSKDGFIGQENKSIWLTNIFSKYLVHKWRSEINAIMVGTRTALQDNPQLTNRLYFGKNPLRIVLDKTNTLPEHLRIFSDDNPTWLITENPVPLRPKNVSVISIPFDESLLPNILKKLHASKIASLMVEGGRQLLQSFINQNLWDEARVLEANVHLREGIQAPQLRGTLTDEYQIDTDLLRIFRNENL
ncbi:MAG: bifunctional diaminohydroxyphosphoribosylaminopyrimidine deaminase/5-amino-6-(5-phosphoribosylamino)uracil reductase RibD [Bacteroidota bacterium]